MMNIILIPSFGSLRRRSQVIPCQTIDFHSNEVTFLKFCAHTSSAVLILAFFGRRIWRRQCIIHGIGMECYYEKQIVGIPIRQIAIFLRAPFNSQIPSTYFHACLYLTVEKSLLGHAVESCYSMERPVMLMSLFIGN